MSVLTNQLPISRDIEYYIQDAPSEIVQIIFEILTPDELANYDDIQEMFVLSDLLDEFKSGCDHKFLYRTFQSLCQFNYHSFHDDSKIRELLIILYRLGLHSSIDRDSLKTLFDTYVIECQNDQFTDELVTIELALYTLLANLKLDTADKIKKAAYDIRNRPLEIIDQLNKKWLTTSDDATLSACEHKMNFEYAVQLHYILCQVVTCLS